MDTITFAMGLVYRGIPPLGQVPKMSTRVPPPELRDGSERDGDVSPLLLSRALGELAFDAGEDRGELAVVERPDEHQAGVRSLGFGPLARKRREVAAVAGYEDALLGARQLENLWIRQALVGGVLGKREHVVSALAQPRRDATR